MILLITIVFMLLSIVGSTNAQQHDPLIGYLLSINEDCWDIGGNLTTIKPPQLRYPLDVKESTSGEVSLSGVYADYYRKGALETSDASFRRGLESKVQFQGHHPFHWLVHLNSRNNKWSLKIPHKSHDQVLAASYNNRSTFIESKAKLDAAIISCGLNTGKMTPTEMYFAAGIDLENNGAIGILWQREYNRPEFQFLRRDEQANITLYGMHEGIKGWIASPQIGLFKAEVTIQRYNWYRSSEQRSQTTLDPWGAQNNYHGFIALDGDHLRIVFGLRGQELDLMAYGKQGSYRYAKITKFDLDLNAMFLSLEFQAARNKIRYMIETEYLKWDGSGRGHIEFWPFTSGLVDFLGMRRYFIATSSGNLSRLHLAFSNLIKNAWRGTIGINLVDIRPQAEVNHWRPEFLFFGKEDEQFHTLDTYRILASMIHLSLKYQQNSWAIQYSITQAIPIKSWKRATEQPDQPTNPIEDKKGSGGYGGGFHRIDFQLYF